MNSEIVIKDQSFNGKSMLQKLYVLYLYYSKVWFGKFASIFVLYLDSKQ